MMMITTKTEITDDHFMHLFISAIESNASTYWAGGGFNVSDKVFEQFSNDKIAWWWNPEFYKTDFQITVEHDGHGSDGDNDYTTIINRASIEKGLQLVAEHFPDTWNEFAKNEGFDINVADTVMQCIVLHDQIVEDNTTGWNAPEKRRGGRTTEWQVMFG